MGKSQYNTKKKVVVVILIRDNLTGEQLFSTSFGVHEKDRQKYISGVIKHKFGIDLTPSDYRHQPQEEKGFFDY